MFEISLADVNLILSDYAVPAATHWTELQPGELRALLLGQLEQDPDLSWLREHPRAQALLQRAHP